MNNHPVALPHDPITKIFDDVYWVQGTIKMGPGMGFNRNMVILRQDGDLTVISPVRLSPEGEAELDALGAVKHVVRIGAHHSLDDAYYMDRYDATFWCQPDSENNPSPRSYQILADFGAFPVSSVDILEFRNAALPECALLLKRDGGILVTCDSLQNHENWNRSSFLTRIVAGMMGFSLRLLVGPPWKKHQTKPNGSLLPDFERLLEIDYEHLIGAHGQPCIGGAKEKVRAAVEAAFKRG